MNVKKLIKVIGLILLSGIGLIFLASLAWLIWWGKTIEADPPSEYATYYQPAPTPGNDLDVIEADAEIKIPSSAREIHAAITGFQELNTWVRLDLPTKGLMEFLGNTRCDTPLTPTDPSKHTRLELDPEWWQPSDAKQLETCTGGHAFLRQRVFVDRTNADTVTIYVFSSVARYETDTPVP
jgi:hypothetical protein